MGLKDKIESNREKEEQAALKQQEEREALNNQNIKSQQEALESKRAKYNEIKDMIAQGKAPEEWVKIYDEFVAKLEEDLSKNKKDYFKKSFEVSKEYYEEVFFFNGKEKCTGDLLNEYLENRFKQEGFYNSSFKLVKTQIAISTPQDQKDYDRGMVEYNKKLAEYNEKQLRNQYSNALDDGVGSLFDQRPKWPELKKSGTAYVYEYILIGEFVKGALKKAGIKNKKKIDSKKLLKALIITAIAIPIAIVLGAAIYFLLV